MREVAHALGQHAEQRQARLDSTLGVVGVEVLADRDAAHGRVAVTELGEAPLRVEAAQQRRTRSRQRRQVKVTAHDVFDRGLSRLGRACVERMTTSPSRLRETSGCGPKGILTTPASSRAESCCERSGGGPASSRLIRPRTLDWKSMNDCIDSPPYSITRAHLVSQDSRHLLGGLHGTAARRERLTEIGLDHLVHVRLDRRRWTRTCASSSANTTLGGIEVAVRGFQAIHGAGKRSGGPTRSQLVSNQRRRGQAAAQIRRVDE